MLKRNLQLVRRLLPNIEPIVLVMLMLGAASLWGFIEIADEVLEGETKSFDIWMLQVLRDQDDPTDPIGPRWLGVAAVDVSALGGFAFVTIATAGIAIYLFIDGKARMALFLIASTLSGGVLGVLLKAYFARPRPDLVPHLSPTFSSSFPSGHSLIAAVVYLTLATLVSSVVSNPWLKLYLLITGEIEAVRVGARMAKKATSNKKPGSMKPVKRVKKKQPSELSGPRKFSELSLKEQEKYLRSLRHFARQLRIAEASKK